MSGVVPQTWTTKTSLLYIFLYRLKTFTRLGATKTKMEIARLSYSSRKQVLVTQYHQVQSDGHNHDDNYDVIAYHTKRQKTKLR
jgi:hypothetical protein